MLTICNTNIISKWIKVIMLVVVMLTALIPVCWTGHQLEKWWNQIKQRHLLKELLIKHKEGSKRNVYSH